MKQLLQEKSGSQQNAISPALQGSLRNWIVGHDDSWLFTIPYVALALALSIWISLFWLVVVVGVHLVLETIRQTLLDHSKVMRRVLWECKLDVSLVLLALALAVYMDVVLGAAGLGGAARLGMQAGARLGGWGRALKGALLSMDDAAQLVRIVAAKKNDKKEVHANKALDSVDFTALTHSKSSVGRWTLGDHVAIWLGAFSTLLILCAPLLTNHTLETTARTLIAELQPLPG